MCCCRRWIGGGQEHGNQADAWNETYINEDADFKYIDPILNNYTVEVNGAIKDAEGYLYAAQGTRS